MADYRWSDLTLRGSEVTLYTRGHYKVVQEKGRIELVEAGEGFAEVSRVTNNMKEAIKDTNVK